MTTPRSRTAEELRAALGARADALCTPALVIDRPAAAHNIARVLDRVGHARRWRPHIKTIKQGPLVSALFEAGVTRLKCATPLEAALACEAARDAGIELDLLLAYPLARAGVDAMLELRRRTPATIAISLLADDVQHLRELDAQCAESTPRMGVFLDVDLGMGRTGQPPEHWAAAREVLAALTGLEFRGLHGYDGHHKGSEAQVAAHAGYDRLLELARRLAPRPRLELVTSGTHSYQHALAHPGLNQADAAGEFEHAISPGTVVLSDRRSGPAVDDLGLKQAAFVATRVVSAGSGRVTLDCGSKGLAPDTPPESFHALGRPELAGRRRSEEHLVCELERSGALPQRGELLWVVPEHVCTTVNMYREAIHLLEDGSIETVAITAAARLPWGLDESSR